MLSVYIIINLVYGLLVLLAAFFLFRLIALVISMGYKVPYVSTPKSVWPEISEKMKLSRHDRIIDLGSGFASIDYYLASSGANVTSLELNRLLITAQVIKNLLSGNKIHVTHGRIEKTDVQKFNIIYMYWQPSALDEYFPAIFQSASKQAVFYSYFYPFPNQYKNQRKIKLSNNRYLYILDR